MKRTPLKKSTTPLKRTALKKARKATGELVMFESIWATRDHVSELSGKKLDNFNVSLFAHLLSKGAFPALRLKFENVRLLTKREHFLLDNGSEEQRQHYANQNNCSWDKIYALRESLKTEYFLSKNAVSL